MCYVANRISEMTAREIKTAGHSISHLLALIYLFQSEGTVHLNLKVAS